MRSSGSDGVAIAERQPRSAIGGGRIFQFVILAIIGVVANLAARAVAPLQEAMRGALSLSDNEVALLQGPALALPVVLAAVPLGWLIDRAARVRLLPVLVALALAGSVLSALAVGMVALFIGRCLVGFSVAGITITTLSLLADMYRPEQRGRMKAIVVIGQYAGASSAFAVGGLLITMFDSATGWRWALFWLTCPLLLIVLATSLLLREPAREGVAVVNPSARDTIAELWERRAILFPLIAGIVLAEVPIFAILTWATPALMRGFSAPPQQAGAIMATATLLSGVAGLALGGMLADLCQRSGGPRRTVGALSGLAFLCAPAGAFVLMPDIAAASVLLIACITLIAAAAAIGVTLFTIVVPNELRGLCLSILAAAASLFGVAFAPVAVSLLSAVLGGPAFIGKSLAYVCITASVLCAAMFAFLRYQLPSNARSA